MPRLRADRLDWESLKEARKEGREMRLSTSSPRASADTTVGDKRKHQQAVETVPAGALTSTNPADVTMARPQIMCTDHARYQLGGRDSDGRAARECRSVRCDYVHFNLLVAGKDDFAHKKAKAGLLKLAGNFKSWPAATS